MSDNYVLALLRTNRPPYMTSEITFIFALILVAGALMATNIIRYDIVALLVVIALILSNTLTVSEALAGFGSSVVILVAALLVVGEMLLQTGVARALSNWILKNAGSNEMPLIILVMLGAGILGMAMSSTAVVAIFIPIVLRITSETNLSPQRLLMPMSYAALISGMLTLIATPPNLVVHYQLREAGFEGLGFFGITPIGFAILAVAIAYILLMGRRLLPQGTDILVSDKPLRSIGEISEDFQIGERIALFRVENDSSLISKTIAEADLESQYGLRILGISRPKRSGVQLIPMPSSDIDLRAKDSLLVMENSQHSDGLNTEQSLMRLPISSKESQRWLWEIGGAVVLIHPESGLIGKSIREGKFRSNYNLQVLGLRHARQVVSNFEDSPLHPSDSLFVVGCWNSIRKLQSHLHDFIVTELPSEHTEVVTSYRRMPTAIAILFTMILLTVFNIIPLVTAVLMAALAAVFTRCITMEDAYQAIHWSSLVLIAGMLPLADALEKSGGTRLLVDSLLSIMKGSGPYMMLTVLFFLTAGIGLILSNTASAVLVSPIAIYAAEALNISPYGFAVAVAIAASAAYSTPVSTPVVTLVVEPGRYSFLDFVKVGVPLLLLTYLVTLLLVPLVFPFIPG